MLTRAALRFIEDGEIIFTTFDTSTGLFTNIQEDIFKFSIYGDKWPVSRIAQVNGADSSVDGKLEKIMLKEKDIICVIAITDCLFFAQSDITISEDSEFNAIYTYKSENKDCLVEYINEGLEGGRFSPIGFRKTVRKCISVKPYQEQLTYDKVTGKLITPNGLIDIEGIDISSLHKDIANVDISLLSSMNIKQDYGLVKLNDNCYRVNIVDNKLVLSK